jgi:hypothetical protein
LDAKTTKDAQGASKSLLQTGKTISKTNGTAKSVSTHRRLNSGRFSDSQTRQASSTSRFSNFIKQHSQIHRAKKQARTSSLPIKVGDAKVAENSTVDDPFCYFDGKVESWSGEIWKNILNFPTEQLDSCCMASACNLYFGQRLFSSNEHMHEQNTFVLNSKKLGICF